MSGPGEEVHLGNIIINIRFVDYSMQTESGQDTMLLLASLN